MRGFRRLPGAEHIVHAVELPELSRRRRPVGGVGAGFGGHGHGSNGASGSRPAFRSVPGSGGPIDGRPTFPRRSNGHGDGAPYELPRPLHLQPAAQRAPQAPPATPPQIQPDAHPPGEVVPAREAAERLGVVDVPRPPAPTAEDNRVALLERRLAKLSKLLDERTQQLQLRMEAQSADPGVASRYAEVQGLRGDSEETQRKRELMSAIFDANRKLRERVGSASPDAE